MLLEWRTEILPFGTPPRFLLELGMHIYPGLFRKLINPFSTAESLILRNNTHTGPVRGLDFNPIQTNLLASGGVAGEVREIRGQNPPTFPLTSFRYIYGILRIRASHIHPLLVHGAQNLMKSRLLLGINRFNTYLLGPAALDTLSFGICEESARSSRWHMGVEQELSLGR